MCVFTKCKYRITIHMCVRYSEFFGFVERVAFYKECLIVCLFACLFVCLFVIQYTRSYVFMRLCVYERGLCMMQHTCTRISIYGLIVILRLSLLMI